MAESAMTDAAATLWKRRRRRRRALAWLLLAASLSAGAWAALFAPPPCEHRPLVLYRATPRGRPPVVLAEEYPPLRGLGPGPAGGGGVVVAPVLLGSDDADGYVVPEYEEVFPGEARVMDARAAREAFGLAPGRWKRIGVLPHTRVWVRVTPRDAYVSVRHDFLKGWDAARWCATYRVDASGRPVFVRPEVPRQ